jgi:hypothetical protein
MFNKFFLRLIWGGCLAVHFGVSCEVTAADNSRIPFTSFVGEGGSFLDECGDKLDCHFTLEAVRLTDVGYDCRCYHSSWDGEKLPETKAELINLLRRGLKDTDVVVDKRNPQIIHIVEKPPEEYRSYPLTKIVTVDFEGTAPALVDRLVMNASSLKLKRMFSIMAGRVPPHDYGTPVKVAAKDATVRDVLTQAIPTKGYARLLWTATSYHGSDSNWQTDIHLHGAQVVKADKAAENR